MDCGGNQFSLQRLQAFLQRADVSSAEEIVHGVVGVVQEFAAGAPQSDDRRFSRCVTWQVREHARSSLASNKW
jgi:serine phosphatase RsbU (regulator of sigma subunit)